MSLFRTLFRKKEATLRDAEIQDDSKEYLKRSSFTAGDEKSRRQYVEGCLIQLQDARRELALLEREYDVVSSHLKDAEKVADMDERERAPIRAVASDILRLEEEKAGIMVTQFSVTEEEYDRMERLSDEVPEGIQKMREEEEYKGKISRDLKRLKDEKTGCEIHIVECKDQISNALGMTRLICIFMGVAIVLLGILGALLELKVLPGIVAVVFIGALGILHYFRKNEDAEAQLAVARRDYNRLITLQNRVKIRYVNNTRLLEYLRMKFGAESSRELAEQWSGYQEESARRERISANSRDYTIRQKELLGLLRKTSLREPSVWLHQVRALTDDKEMVELRHSLNVRRQSLREQMDYNRALAEEARQEITDINKEYPQYNREILDIIEMFERSEG